MGSTPTRPIHQFSRFHSSSRVSDESYRGLARNEGFFRVSWFEWRTTAIKTLATPLKSTQGIALRPNDVILSSSLIKLGMMKWYEITL